MSKEKTTRASVVRLTAAVAGFAALTTGLVSPTTGHDEDWRKLRDRKPPLTATPANPESEGVTLLKHFTLGQMPGGQGAGNDCWGYVSPSGREIAIMGVQKGFVFFDITDPKNATIIGNVVGPSSTWHDIKVIGHYAYGVSEGGSGIQVVDLSQVDQGIVTHVGNVQKSGHSSTHNIAANPDSGYLYLCGANISNGGLVAVDTNANPADPTIVGAWNAMYVHDAQIVTYTSGPFAGKEIAFCASGFGGGFTSTGLRVVDVTNKSNMVTIGEVFWPNPGYSHQCWLSEDRQYLYLGDELDEQNSGITTRTIVFDVSNPGNPTYLGSFTNGQNAIDHNMYTRDGFLFQANYTSGLRVYDLSNPTSPTEIAWYDTSPSGGASFNGAWSCYPFFPSGTVLVSDIEGGLFILDVTVISQGSLSFNIVNNIPSILTPATPQDVVVEISEFKTTLVPGTVNLNVSVDGGAYVAYSMAPLGGMQYEAQIPGVPCKSKVDWFVSAEAASGNTHQSATSSHDVYVGLIDSFADNFETDKGWVAENLGATTGDWDRGVPVNDPNWAYDPMSDGDGSGQCLLTENATGNTDVDNGAVRITSPVIDMSEPGSNIVYKYYLNLTDTSGIDRLLVEANSTGGMGTWTELVAHTSNNGTNWADHQITDAEVIAKGVTPTATMKFRFTANDSNPQSIVEAGIDGFRVVTIDCGQQCYADCDGSGDLDLFDFLCFTNAFNNQDPYADCDGSGGFDLFDFLCFTNEFNAGCP
jgi:choice-of-anchor B domain-containing protein